MAEQLTFQLPVKASRERGDFFVSAANALAVSRMDDTEGWTRGKLALTGPEKSGKSHLAHVWCEAEGAWMANPRALLVADISAIDTAVAVEVGDGVMGAAEEEALFHLHNHLTAFGLPLLLVARDAPARWPVGLPDLKSRLEAIEVVRIDPPDDALLSAVLVKLFADRQLQVAADLVGWLVPRMERSFAECERVVAALDEAALSERRKINRSLAREVLDNLHGEAR